MTSVVAYLLGRKYLSSNFRQLGIMLTSGPTSYMTPESESQ